MALWASRIVRGAVLRSQGMLLCHPDSRRHAVPAPKHLYHTCRGVVCALARDEGGLSDTEEDEQPVSASRAVRVERLVANLGYGKRKEVQKMVKRGLVTRLNGSRLKVGERVRYGEVLVEGEALDPPYPMTVLLHKPAGYVVTSPDDENVQDPVVYDLLPYRFGRRRPFLACVGRLDKETSGLLVLTDDGQLLHRIVSPKKGIWKVYEATLRDPLDPMQVENATRIFASGTFTLIGDRTPLLPAKLTMVDPTHFKVALCEGRYHQIRRMFATLGHEVVALHRASIGALSLKGVEPSSWRYATQADIQAIFSSEDEDKEVDVAPRRHEQDDAESQALYDGGPRSKFEVLESLVGEDGETLEVDEEGAMQGMKKYRHSQRWQQKRRQLQKNMASLK